MSGWMRGSIAVWPERPATSRERPTRSPLASVAVTRPVAAPTGHQVDARRGQPGAVAREGGRARDGGAAAAVRTARPLPPILGSKKFLDFTPAHYYSSLARLVGLTHDLDTQAVESAVISFEPRSTSGPRSRRCASPASSPDCVVDTKTLDVIARGWGPCLREHASAIPCPTDGTEGRPPVAVGEAAGSTTDGRLVAQGRKRRRPTQSISAVSRRRR